MVGSLTSYLRRLPGRYGIATRAALKTYRIPLKECDSIMKKEDSCYGIYHSHIDLYAITFPPAVRVHKLRDCWGADPGYPIFRLNTEV